MSEHPEPWGAIERARNGDPAALAELYEEYGHLVHRIAFRLTGTAQDADDVLQDVFVALPEGLRTFDGRGSVESWVKRIAARRSLMALRKEKHRREVSFWSMAAYRMAANPEPAVEKVALEKAMAQLPDPLRAVFVLKEVEGYSHEEIGDMLGIGVSGSTSKLHRARKVLRELLRSSA